MAENQAQHRAGLFDIRFIIGALILTVLTSLLIALQMPEAVRQILFGAIIIFVAAAYTRVTGES